MNYFCNPFTRKLPKDSIFLPPNPIRGHLFSAIFGSTLSVFVWPLITKLRATGMGSFLSSTKKSMELDKNMAVDKAKELSTSAPVVVFSKSYCGYCKRVKQLFTQIGASFKVIELDEQSDGGDIQLALAEWTGLRTVPNVFIGGKHIGGCDTVMGKYHGGQLLPLLTDAGATVNNSAER